MKARAYLLGIDCGLTVAKAAVFDEAGRKYSESKAATPLNGLRMDANGLWERVAGCVRSAMEQAGMPEIAAVGLSGHGNGLYALDAQGAPVLAVSSMYDENQQAVDAFRASSQYARWFALSRQSCWGGHPMQILRQLKEESPEAYGRIRHLLFCKDFIRYQLTGTLATDWSDESAGALCGGNGEAFELLGIPEMAGILPKRVRCEEISGRVSPQAAMVTGLKEGTIVCGGGIDLFACMQGAGITAPGTVSVTAGTWGIGAAYAPELTNLSALTQACRFHPALPEAAVVSSPTSCVNLDWFLRGIRPELRLEQTNEIVLSYGPGDVDGLYLPYLYRDMARPYVSASFRGLRPSHRWQEMLRMVYEGVCYAHRLQLDRLRRAGAPFDRARLTGGAANGEAWCRLLCDILCIPLEIPQEKQAGLLGAAMMAAVCAGLFPDLTAAAQAMSQVERVYEPQPHPAYDGKYQFFLKEAGEIK